MQRLRGFSTDGRNIVLLTLHRNVFPPEIDRVVLLQGGRIAADGPKESVLDPEMLSRVYKTEVRVAQIDGYYLAYPGRSGKDRKSTRLNSSH